MKTHFFRVGLIACSALAISGPALAGISEQDLYVPPPNAEDNSSFGGEPLEGDVLERPHVPYTEPATAEGKGTLVVDNTNANTPVTPPEGYGTPLADGETAGDSQSSGSTPSAAARKTVTRSYENENGSVVDTHKRVTIDEDANVRSARQFDITDSDGNSVATGRDRDWKNVDGSEGSSQAAVRNDADGNRILKRRQEQENADGDQRSRNGKTVTDADGNVVAKGRNGEASKDGTTYKTQTRSRNNADGDTVSKTRRGKVDANGKKTIVKQPRTARPNAGSGARKLSRRKRR